ncbi:CHAT domain-containing protein [Leptolyngbya ohadii]|uniref:CHAT domain-containing protein n=1 Tax=Leptolyngbya ohadii TaxID=1962290 RepID=UPI000B5A1CDF|nr:CHAT domain-containing protein [Leptolyngbya ohadii]
MLGHNRFFHFSIFFLAIFQRPEFEHPRVHLLGLSAGSFQSHKGEYVVNANLSVNKKAEADHLLEIGINLTIERNYSSAIQSLEQALRAYREIKELYGEGESLYWIAAIYQSQGYYLQSRQACQQALEIARRINSLEQEWQILTLIGLTYTEQGQFAEALASNSEALLIVQILGNSLGEQSILHNIALIYTYLGQYEQALETYQKNLALIHSANVTTSEEQRRLRNFEGLTLYNIGLVYENLQLYDEAIRSYKKALSIVKEVGDLSTEVSVLNSIGYTYYLTNQIEPALSFLEQALATAQRLGDFDNLPKILNNLGRIYTNLDQFDLAESSLKQALNISLKNESLVQQQLVLSNIGDLLVQQNQPELAIVFYKRSVNVTESIRRDIQGLPIEQQQSYTNTIADTYRKLAALLIQQDRILEAQQVLDLLKVQEIQDYLRRGVRSSEQTSQGVYLWEAEQRVFASFETLLQDGQRLAELQAIAPEELTAEQRTELLELHQKSQQIQATFNRFVDLPDVQAALQRLRLNARQAFDLENLNQLRSNLSQLRSDAVLLYPLVLDDRLELVILSPNLDPLHKTVDVTRVELNQTISDFLHDLRNPESDPKPNAAKLYDWLIRPIEGFLRESGAKVVLYAPDRQLRYIPLAALYDGQQWFVENYQINHITAVSLTNLNTPPRPNPRILAGAYSEGRHLIARRGESPLPFRGLPFAKVEVQTIASLFPGTRQLINQDFTEASTLPFLNSYNIVHFATHAIFTTGSSEDSYIVMGNGDTIDLNEIRTLSLGNVDLMVLSGCQTAVNNVNLGQELGEGTEILGFGYQVQNAGARATIASLWSVDDGGTEVLMSQFYALLQQANRSKTETLQQAQIALIREQENFQLQDALIRERNAGDLPRISAQELTHPYYWAPFILIGNGL